MTSSDGMNPQNWDEARIALRRVAQFFNENDAFALADLQALENYQLIPEQVRETLEDLTYEERETLKKFFITLESNHFFLENSRGGMEGMY